METFSETTNINIEKRNELMIKAIEVKKKTSEDYAISALLKRKFEFVKFIGKGTFGDVMLMVKPDGKTKIAMKMILEQLSTPGEMIYWPKLQHENIQVLEEIFYFPKVEAYGFLMELQNTSLDDILQDDRVMTSATALRRVKKWIKQVLMGLSYLHGQGLSHNDLKVDNVLISMDDRAVVIDFGFLNKCDKPTRKYGTPIHYRPPESLPYAAGSNFPVDGRALDSWTTGLLVAECFTGHGVVLLLHSQEKTWSDVMYPLMFQLFQQEYFGKVVELVFPSATLELHDLQLMHNFMLMFLQLDASKRPSMEKALDHKLFPGGSYEAAIDDIWKVKADSTMIDTFVEKYRQIIGKETLIDDGYSNCLPEKTATITTISTMKDGFYGDTENTSKRNYIDQENELFPKKDFEAVESVQTFSMKKDPWNECNKSTLNAWDEEAWKIPSNNTNLEIVNESFGAKIQVKNVNNLQLESWNPWNIVMESLDEEDAWRIIPDYESVDAFTADTTDENTHLNSPTTYEKLEQCTEISESGDISNDNINDNDISKGDSFISFSGIFKESLECLNKRNGTDNSLTSENTTSETNSENFVPHHVTTNDLMQKNTNENKNPNEIGKLYDSYDFSENSESAVKNFAMKRDETSSEGEKLDICEKTEKIPNVSTEKVSSFRRFARWLRKKTLKIGNLCVCGRNSAKI